MGGKIKFLKFSFNTAMSKMRGSCAVMAKLVSPSIVEAEKLPETGEIPTTHRASTIENPDQVRQNIEASIKALDREVERIVDTKILSAEAETGAVQGTSAGVLDSVKSDPEKSGTVAKTLEDGGLGRFIAPGLSLIHI